MSKSTTLPRASTIILACLLAPTLASAEAAFYRPLSDETLASARAKIVNALAKDGKTGDMADLLLELDAFATLDDDQCPGFTVDVLNATNRTLWAITVTIDQESGVKKKSDVFHLPYLPAKSQTTISVGCLENYTYSYSRYDYLGGGSTTITVDPYAESPKGAALQFAALAKQVSDAELSSATITKATSGSDTLLQVALNMNDPAIARDLVTGIAATGFGTKELGQALATNEALATVVGEQLATLPAAQQTKLARALLASPAAEAWTEKLAPIIDKLCTGARPEVVALWAAAQGTKNVPVVALRDRVRAKCVLQATDAATLVAALEAAPGLSGDAIDATDEKVFAAIVAEWKLEAKRDGVAGSHWAYIADTNSAARFDAAIAVLPKDDHGDAIAIVAAGKPSSDAASPAAARKAAWIEATATALGLDAQDELVRDLFTKLVNGEITDPAMRAAVRELKKLAPGAADGIVASYANEHGKVFDSGKLVDAGIDSLDYLAFATESLADCTSTLELLEACARKVAASKLPLVKAGEALKTDFKSSMRQLLFGVSRERMVAASKTIATAGWSTAVVVDKLCDDARDSINYNTGDLDATIRLVEQVPGGDACIASISDQASAKRRKVIIMTILALCGLILPMPLGGLWLKRKWKQLQGELPKDKVEEQAGPRLDDRLGAGGLGRALTAAISDARRSVAIAGLEAIAIDARPNAAGNANVIDRIAATVARAVKSGEAATFLAKLGGHALYVAALPVSDARPQLVARYLGAEWPAHFATIEASAGLPVVAVIVLCSPTAQDATLLVASRSSPPEALLDAREARELGANSFTARMNLRATQDRTTQEVAS